MTVSARRTASGRSSELDELARLFDALRKAAFDGEGVSRLAYSERESEALDMIEAEARRIGLVTERDAAANLVATLPGAEEDLPFIACGSHLDSVPQGGNYDGAAGVLAALMVLSRLRNENLRPRRPVKLYALRGEPPQRPGMVRVGNGGAAVELEVWSLPTRRFGEFVRQIPAPLGIGTVSLADGTAVQGFLCESHATKDASDITALGSWRAYLKVLG